NRIIPKASPPARENIRVRLWSPFLNNLHTAILNVPIFNILYEPLTKSRATKLTPDNSTTYKSQFYYTCKRTLQHLPYSRQYPKIRQHNVAYSRTRICEYDNIIIY